MMWLKYVPIVELLSLQNGEKVQMAQKRKSISFMFIDSYWLEIGFVMRAVCDGRKKINKNSKVLIFRVF
jgi:hypothetical protein